MSSRGKLCEKVLLNHELVMEKGLSCRLFMAEMNVPRPKESIALLLHLGDTNVAISVTL